ncbi:hypothetical protein D3C85_892560 [compost metagenome]
MPQQFVARRVAAGIVDQFELIQIEEHQGMATRVAGQVMQRLFQAIFELSAVGKPGQGVVGRLPRQIGDVLPLLGHVMQHQHRPADFAGIADRRAHQRDRHRAAVQALNQLGVFTAATELAAENMLDQGETVGLGIFVQQVEQRRQRQPRRLLGLPVGQRFGRRIHVGNRTGNIRGDHAVANRLQGDLRPVFLQLQRIGEGMALLEQFMGAHQGQCNQAQGGGEVGHQQQSQDHPRAFAQGIAEGLRRRCHTFVDDEYLILPALDIGIGGLPGGDALMHLPRNGIELHQIRVAHPPKVDGFLVVTEVPEIQVQPDHTGDVIRMVAALEDRHTCRLDVRRPLIERHT